VAYACVEVCLSSIDKTLGSPLQGELEFLIEFGAWFDLPWFKGELVLLPWFQGGMVFAIEKSCVLITSLLSFELGVCRTYCLVLGGVVLLSCIFVSLCFSLVFSSYSPKSFCITCYTSLYLFNYAYHCARMSSNEM
jgi:hypothetical protein